MISRLLFVARHLTGALMAALVATAAAAQPTTAPFKAKLALTEAVALTGLAPCFAIGSVQATGTASPLGRVTGTSRDCINPQGLFNPIGANAFTFASLGAAVGGLVLHGANGDALFMAYSGTLTPQAGRPHRVAGQFIIVGGTGRFTNATGGGLLYGQEDISQVIYGFGDIEAIGMISY